MAAIGALIAVTIALCFSFATGAFDTCRSHKTSESKKVAAYIAGRLSDAGFFRIEDAISTAPLYYCLAGPKSDLSERRELIKRFSSTVKLQPEKCGFWGADARLIIFFKNHLLDVPIPFNIKQITADHESYCTTNVSEIIQMH